ncbi:hypothetical protein TNCV_3823711 [Trichonephila clavipes]|nr:hypothetical protein TNCV_3823711 [Trichonephila clavipes]
MYKEEAEVNMPLRRFRRQYEQLSQFERGRIISRREDGWLARRVAHQLGRSDYVVRSQLLHRPPCNTSTMGALCLLEPYEGAWLKGIWDRAAPITCAALDTHPSTLPFGVVTRTRNLDWNEMEPGRL